MIRALVTLLRLIQERHRGPAYKPEHPWFAARRTYLEEHA